jgi:hypothetical protein
MSKKSVSLSRQFAALTDKGFQLEKRDRNRLVESLARELQIDQYLEGEGPDSEKWQFSRRGKFPDAYTNLKNAISSIDEFQGLSVGQVLEKCKVEKLTILDSVNEVVSEFSSRPLQSSSLRSRKRKYKDGDENDNDVSEDDEGVEFVENNGAEDSQAAQAVEGDNHELKPIPNKYNDSWSTKYPITNLFHYSHPNFTCSLEASKSVHPPELQVKALKQKAEAAGTPNSNNLEKHLKSYHSRGYLYESNQFQKEGEKISINIYNEWMRVKDMPTRSASNIDRLAAIRDYWDEEARKISQLGGKGQQTLDNVVVTINVNVLRKQAAFDLFTLRLKRLAMMASTGNGFSIFDNEELRQYELDLVDFGLRQAGQKSMSSQPSWGETTPRILEKNTIGKRSTMRSHLDALYLAVSHFQMWKLQQAPGFSISADVWSAKSCRFSLLGITYSYVSAEDGKKREMVLDMMPLHDNHTSRYLAYCMVQKMIKRVSAGQVLYNVAVDGASAAQKSASMMVDMMEELMKARSSDNNLQEIENSFDSLGGSSEESDRAQHCVAHRLNLVVTDILKNASSDVKSVLLKATLASKTIHQSSALNSSLSQISELLQHRQLQQLETKISVKKLKTHSETRWMSIVDVVERYIDQHTVLCFLVETDQLDADCLANEQELALLTHFKELLLPFRKAVKMVQTIGSKLTCEWPKMVVRLYTSVSDRVAHPDFSHKLVDTGQCLIKSVEDRLVLPLFGEETVSWLAMSVDPCYGILVAQDCMEQLEGLLVASRGSSFKDDQARSVSDMMTLLNGKIVSWYRYFWDEHITAKKASSNHFSDTVDIESDDRLKEKKDRLNAIFGNQSRKSNNDAISEEKAKEIVEEFLRIIAIDYSSKFNDNHSDEEKMSSDNWSDLREKYLVSFLDDLRAKDTTEARVMIAVVLLLLSGLLYW